MITTENELEVLIKCDPGAKIWRYMDLGKFELLLREKALFLCRSDKFSDPFEGSVPRREAEHRIKEEMKIARIHNRPTTPERAKEQSDQIGDFHRRCKRSFVVNCWHINLSESDAMWRLYLKTNEGVAIQSTYQRLVDSLENNQEEIFISKVRYLDYENDIYYHPTEYPRRSYNLFCPIVHKRNSFAHEQELRVFQQINEAINDDHYWEITPTWQKFIPFLKLKPKIKIGKNIPCNIEQLIDRVILPPTSDQYVANKVANF